MWKVLPLLFILSGPVYSTPVSESARIEQDIENGKLLDRTITAMGYAIQTGAAELRKRGHEQDAAELENEWFDRVQFDIRAYASSYGIGDHKPISLWIRQKIQMLTLVLGINAMKATHLIDLEVLNSTIPVVFKPCNPEWDRDEYRNHFSRDDNYQHTNTMVYALLPVVSYWLSYGGCCGATLGSGFILVCSLAGNLVEKVIGNFVSDRLAYKIYDKACGGENASVFSHNH